MNDIRPNFSKRVLDGLPKHINIPDSMPLIITADAYLHPEMMNEAISSYIERRKRINAKISESTSE